MTPIAIEQHGAARVLRFQRPEARNAIDDATANALVAALSAAEQDETSCCVVLASSHDRVFLSGGDLRELRQLVGDPAGGPTIAARGVELGAVERCRLPVIAAVQGATFGGGCELLMMCDVIVMERSASLQFVHGRMGLTPAWGGTTRLLERVGAGDAAQLLLTAKRIDGVEAQRIGLAQQLADDGRGLEQALALAEQMAQLGRPSLIALKRSLMAVKEARRGGALDAGRQVFEEAFASGRVKQAVAAFFKK